MAALHKLRAVQYLKHRHREESDAVAVDLDLSFDCNEVRGMFFSGRMLWYCYNTAVPMFFALFGWGISLTLVILTYIHKEAPLKRFLF